MSTSVSLPALGEWITEATVTRWLKQVGDWVEADEPLLEMSTDFVDVEIPSPVSGVLLEVKAAEDETIEVGGTLAVIEGVSLTVREQQPGPVPVHAFEPGSAAIQNGLAAVARTTSIEFEVWPIGAVDRLTRMKESLLDHGLSLPATREVIFDLIEIYEDVTGEDRSYLVAAIVADDEAVPEGTRIQPRSQLLGTRNHQQRLRRARRYVGGQATGLRSRHGDL